MKVFLFIGSSLCTPPSSLSSSSRQQNLLKTPKVHSKVFLFSLCKHLFVDKLLLLWMIMMTHGFIYVSARHEKTRRRRKVPEISNDKLLSFTFFLSYQLIKFSTFRSVATTKLNLDMIRINHKTSHLLVITALFILVKYSKNEGVKHIDWPSHVITI